VDPSSVNVRNKINIRHKIILNRNEDSRSSEHKSVLRDFISSSVFPGYLWVPKTSGYPGHESGKHFYLEKNLFFIELPIIIF